jgi:hypothetical protein
MRRLVRRAWGLLELIGGLVGKKGGTSFALP